MQTKHRVLLLIDAVVNLVLGAALLLSPVGLLNLLGMPTMGTYFYATILGGVIFGIGVALVVELAGAHSGVGGLGLGGAIAINLCGGSVLLVWLLAASLPIPTHGRIILWSLAIVVLGIGIAEVFAKPWKHQ